MKNKNLESILMVLGNLTLLGSIYYIVFFKDFSGWWFVLPLLFNFRQSKNDNDK